MQRYGVSEATRVRDFRDREIRRSEKILRALELMPFEVVARALTDQSEKEVAELISAHLKHRREIFHA
jgi:hypothetical protein